MKNLFAPCTPARPIALAATLFACGTVEMFAQAAPANQDVQALVAEIRELKSRLAAVEAKLDAYQAAPVVPKTVTSRRSNASKANDVPSKLFAQSVSWRFAQRRRIGFMVVQ